MSLTTETYKFYFKICYTERTYYLNFASNTTIKKFITQVTTYIRAVQDEYFNFEIVETGQPEGEEAPKINYLDEYTLRDIYSHKWRNVSFYIRIIPSGQN
jgi:hypothetical protein